MKKIFLILIIVFASLLMVGCVSAEGIFSIFENSASNNTSVDSQFVVGFDPESPPFTYEDDNGNYTGFDLELAQEVARRNNWTFVPLPIIDWNSKEVELQSGEIDCIWSEFTVTGRQSDYTWSEPYFNNSQVFVVKNDSGINSPGDLKGKNVEIIESSSGLQTLNENNKTLRDSFAKLTEIRDYNTGFMDLESGVCDVLIVDSGVANYHLETEHADDKLKILDEPLSFEEYAIGFKKGNDELKNQVQKTLDEMFKDGTVEKIAQNYSEYDIPEGVIYR